MAFKVHQLLKLCTPEDTISIILVKGLERVGYTYKQSELTTSTLGALMTVTCIISL